ncbi:LysR substrate-binding domain-containing protein [Microtetraspora sp. NBRC 16547]|uniref:LysR substrate-binding domain-containing protein n=1 Tax=Microtetraspora sp. NBRC 16547 TaxID=3030993 RepID=UPI0024A465A1|nr:LysR substrate-binding domain-containing protein [Microtetraspora sp. NBRC 16547]GLW97809.1 LysR family transcriptional regulator [Microtetraspora sp. NBRC 16547]
MELRHLRYFAAVAETCHFGKAAERLHMAQPPLSQAIRQLEAELGAELFTRTTRRVSLTPAGQSFHDDVTRLLRALDDGVARARKIAAGKAGVLRVAFTGTAAYQYLPGIARIVREHLGDVALEVHSDMLTPEQEDALLDGRVDVGVLRPPLRHDDLIETRTIAAEPLILVVPVGHRLADRDDVTMDELRHEAFVMYTGEGSIVNEAVRRSCHLAGFTPRRAHEGAGTGTVLSLVAAGLGIALVPSSVKSVALHGVAFRPVRDAVTVDLALAWRADDSSPLLHRLIEALTGHLAIGSAPDVASPTTSEERS